MTAYLINRALDDTFSLRYMHKVAKADVRELVSGACNKARVLSKRLYDGAQWLKAESIECARNSLWTLAVLSVFVLLIWLLSNVGTLFRVVLRFFRWVSSDGVPNIVLYAREIVCVTLFLAVIIDRVFAGENSNISR